MGLMTRISLAGHGASDILNSLRQFNLRGLNDAVIVAAVESRSIAVYVVATAESAAELA